jgi:hypothetical protein
MKFNSGPKPKFSKSKSFSNFQRRELSQTEKSLLDKYNNEKKKKNSIKINFYCKKIKDVINPNKDGLNLRTKNLKIYDNYYYSIIIHKKNKEYYNNLYNDENIDTINITNKQINNNDAHSQINFPKNILSKTKNILELNSKNYSYNNIFDSNKSNNIPKLLTINDNKKMNDLLYERNKFSKLNPNNTLNNKSINSTMIKSLKNNYYNYSRVYQKKIAKKKIKNKIVYKAVKALKEKRNDNKTELKNYNIFNSSNIYKNLRLDNSESNYKNTWLKYSSKMTDLINKNKKKFFLK